MNLARQKIASVVCLPNRRFSWWLTRHRPLGLSHAYVGLSRIFFFSLVLPSGDQLPHRQPRPVHGVVRGEKDCHPTHQVIQMYYSLHPVESVVLAMGNCPTECVILDLQARASIFLFRHVLSYVAFRFVLILRHRVMQSLVELF